MKYSRNKKYIILVLVCIAIITIVLILYNNSLKKHIKGEIDKQIQQQGKNRS